MRFEARELKPYAETISAEEIRDGEVYFSVMFVDDNLHFPVMETLVFIGKNLEKGDREKLYFQDIDSYSEGKRYGATSDNDGINLLACPEDQPNHIFDFEHALEQLMACSLRRRDADC